MEKWNKRFTDMIDHVSGWSKDKNTKVGAIIVNEDKRIVSVGYNGFPIGVNDNIDSRHERPSKYLYTEHAERNAIYNAINIGANIKGCIMYVNMFPCADCARAIIQSGIKMVISKKPDLAHKTWGDHSKASLEMFMETKTEVVYYE